MTDGGFCFLAGVTSTFFQDRLALYASGSFVMMPEERKLSLKLRLFLYAQRVLELSRINVFLYS